MVVEPPRTPAGWVGLNIMVGLAFLEPFPLTRQLHADSRLTPRSIRWSGKACQMQTSVPDVIDASDDTLTLYRPHSPVRVIREVLARPPVPSDGPVARSYDPSKSRAEHHFSSLARGHDGCYSRERS